MVKTTEMTTGPIIAAALVGALAFTGVQTAQAQPAGKPNIVFSLTDNLGFGPPEE